MTGRVSGNGRQRQRGGRGDEDIPWGPLFAGDGAAWEAFCRMASPIVLAAVRRSGVEAGGDMEDVAQDVFVRLVRDDFALLRRFDAERSRLSTWLTVISRSSAIDFLRRRGRPADRAAAPLDGVEERHLAVAPALRDRLKIPAAMLSSRQRVVLHMLYDRDMDVAEVAAVLDVDPQTVRSTRHKALEKLRRHFRAGDDDGMAD